MTIDRHVGHNMETLQHLERPHEMRHNLQQHKNDIHFGIYRAVWLLQYGPKRRLSGE